MSTTSLLTASARKHLAPMGLRQKGRSRTWLDDQGLWVGVVEFQPSQGGGSYLNVGVCWLWADIDHFAFNVGYRVARRQRYVSDEQLAPIADTLAFAAAEKVTEYRRAFPDPDSAAAYLSTHNGSEAGMAYALAGNPEAAIRHVRRSALPRDEMAQLAAIGRDGDLLRSWVEQRIASSRSKLRLLD